MTAAIRHAHRCVRFTPPKNPADLANALTDAVMNTPPGMMLVYRVGPVTRAIHKIMAEASLVADRIPGCALVSWPNGGPDDRERTWCWAIQRRGRLAA